MTFTLSAFPLISDPIIEMWIKGNKLSLSPRNPCVPMQIRLPVTQTTSNTSSIMSFKFYFTLSCLRTKCDESIVTYWVCMTNTRCSSSPWYIYIYICIYIYVWYGIPFAPRYLLKCPFYNINRKWIRLLAKDIIDIKQTMLSTSYRLSTFHLLFYWVCHVISGVKNR